MKEKMGILITIDYATVEKQYACIVSFANSNTFSLVHLLIPIFSLYKRAGMK